MIDSKAEQLPYDPTTTQEWINEVNSWQWIQLGPKKWKKVGQCQRCKHDMYVLAIGIWSIPGVAAAREIEVPPMVYGECNCGYPHPDRPENETGCGPDGFFPTPTSPEDSVPYMTGEIA